MFKKIYNQLYYKFRYAFLARSVSLDTMKFDINHTVNESSKIKLDSNIVIIGFGVAAYHLIMHLHSLGFKNVTVVAKDKLAGGKCVHFGCMPIEFLLSDSYKKNNDVQRINEFTKSLGLGIEKQIASTGYKIIQDEFIEVTDQKAILKSGQSIQFDRLFIATGQNQVSLKDSRPESVWKMLNKKIAILCFNEPNALALAEVAVRLNNTVTVFSERKFIFSNLPSFKYYLDKISKLGVLILEGKKSAFNVNDFDEVIELSRPNPYELVKINGQYKNIYQLDLNSMSFAGYENIHFIGDVAGGFTAVEAEQQAFNMIDYLINGKVFDVVNQIKLPLRFHGECSWASVGDFSVAFNESWKEIDFNQISWSAVHNLNGKLWYLYDAKNFKIKAIQICHPNATELITIAASLLNYTIFDDVWLNMQVHPSASEIFLVLVKHLRLNEMKLKIEQNASVFSNQLKLSFKYPTNDLLEERMLQSGYLDIRQVKDILMQNKKELALFIYCMTLLKDKSSLFNLTYEEMVKLRHNCSFSASENEFKIKHDNFEVQLI